MPGGRQGAPGFDPNRLRSAREARHLTRGALAAAADVHENEVKEWETGRRVPQVEAVAALARALRLDSPLDLLAQDADQGLTLQRLRLAAGLSQQRAGETVSISEEDAAAIGRALGVDADEVHAARTVSRALYLERRSTRFGRDRRRSGED